MKAKLKMFFLYAEGWLTNFAHYNTLTHTLFMLVCGWPINSPRKNTVDFSEKAHSTHLLFAPVTSRYVQHSSLHACEDLILSTGFKKRAPLFNESRVRIILPFFSSKLFRQILGAE